MHINQLCLSIISVGYTLYIIKQLGIDGIVPTLIFYSWKLLILLNTTFFHSLKCFTFFNVYRSKVNIGFLTIIF